MAASRIFSDEIQFLTAATERLSRALKHGCRVGSDRLDRGKTYQNNQRNHHRILNSRRTIFGSDEAADFLE